MDYQRITPRARQGTTGVSLEYNLNANEGCWINPPDRVAAITVAVHIPDGATGSFTIEACCNTTETIGENGTGGYWDYIDEGNPIYSKSKVVMIANAVTGIRVLCKDITEGYKLNVCFVG